MLRHLPKGAARGKHFFIELDNETAIRSHLGMYGSWHRYRPGDEWQRRRNLGGGRRVTRFDPDQAGRLWVYGRSDQPCLMRDTPITHRRMGRHHRGTYWCPSCQPHVNSASAGEDAR